MYPWEAIKYSIEFKCKSLLSNNRSTLCAPANNILVKTSIQYKTRGWVYCTQDLPIACYNNSHKAWPLLRFVVSVCVCMEFFISDITFVTLPFDDDLGIGDAWGTGSSLRGNNSGSFFKVVSHSLSQLWVYKYISTALIIITITTLQF